VRRFIAALVFFKQAADKIPRYARKSNMFRSWRLGNAFGIGIYLHWTFFLLLALVFFGNLDAGETAAVSALAMIGAVFACVVLHELGHALMARYYGIPTRDITLYPIGGVARLERMSERPWEEFWIALAGPAVNVAIAIVLALVLGFLGSDVFYRSPFQSPQLSNFLAHLLGANVILVLFNLIPAFPMDGGRVLRALLASWLGRVRATRIAAALGVAMAFVFFAIGLFDHTPMLMLIALFVYFAGQQELAGVLRRQGPGDDAPADFSAPGAYSQPGGYAPSSGGFSGFTWDDRTRRWTLWQNGRPVQTIWVE
jgi:Zn-dependent protease